MAMRKEYNELIMEMLIMAGQMARIGRKAGRLNVFIAPFNESSGGGLLEAADDLHRAALTMKETLKPRMEGIMDTRQMVYEWLKLRDMDGLKNTDGSCTCGLTDLMYCDNPDKSGCVARKTQKDTGMLTGGGHEG